MKRDSHTGKGKRFLLTTECAVGIASGVEDNRACLPEKKKHTHTHNASVGAELSFVIPREACPCPEFTSLRCPTEAWDVLSMDVAGKIKGS